MTTYDQLPSFNEDLGLNSEDQNKPQGQVQEKFFDLADAVDTLVFGIQNFESDTFSASEAGIDRATAQAMAAFLIRAALFDDVPGEWLDGAAIGHAWDNVQEARQAQIDSLQ